MRAFVIPVATAAVLFVAGPAFAEETGAPAAPSGAPASAAEQGSSTAGKPAAKNEMSSHDSNASKQGTQVDPHKQSK